MLEMLKRTVFAGIGAAVTTKERVESILQEWVEQGKLTKEEAAKMANKIAEDGKKEFERSREEISQNLQKAFGREKYVSEEEYGKLEARVAMLEAAEAVRQKEEAKTKPAAKSASKKDS